MSIQVKRWVTIHELMKLFGLKSRRSVYLWREAGLPHHEVLKTPGGNGRIAYDVFEVMNWCQQNGRALPLSFAQHLKAVQKNEKAGYRLPVDDVLTELEHGSVSDAPFGRQIFSV